MSRYVTTDFESGMDVGRQAVEARLKAENEKLREERDTYRDLVGCMVHPDIPDQLAAEKTKLRELVAELYEDQCDECDRWKYRDRMREMGVDVDDSL